MVILRSKLLPAWFGWFGLLVALAGVLGPLGGIAFPAVGVWILILSGFLLRRPAPATKPALQPTLA